jgi:hypothetical protein
LKSIGDDDHLEASFKTKALATVPHSRTYIRFEINAKQFCSEARGWWIRLL